MTLSIADGVSSIVVSTPSRGGVSSIGDVRGVIGDGSSGVTGNDSYDIKAGDWLGPRRLGEFDKLGGF